MIIKIKVFWRHGLNKARLGMSGKWGGLGTENPRVGSSILSLGIKNAIMSQGLASRRLALFSLQPVCDSDPLGRSGFHFLIRPVDYGQWIQKDHFIGIPHIIPNEPAIVDIRRRLAEREMQMRKYFCF